MGAYKKLPGEERQMVGAFSVECPACGAPPGFACRKPKGRTQYDTHKARRERAYAQALAQAFDVSYRLEHPGPTHIMPRSGAFISVHLHAPPQHVDLRTRRAGPQKPISRLSGAIYARSCIRTSENTPSRHSVESHLAGCHRVLRVSS